MAEERARRAPAKPARRPEDWNAERVAAQLVPRREELVEELPRELAAARGLSRDQRELVVDEAIDYMVTEYGKPIKDRQHLERAFWTAASLRVKRVHEGRGSTVRAGWQRVDFENVEIAAREPDPAAVAVAELERAVLLEFAATLTETQRTVLAAKYGEGPRELGRRVVARMLGMPMGEVRKAERAIARKLESFVALVSAGTLCEDRGPDLEALAVGTADAQQEIAARLHLRYYASCRAGYAENLRALRTGELQRRIAQLLPPLPAVEETRRNRTGPWDALFDWLSRPFTSESANTSAQLLAGARGAGTVLTAKLTALCIGGVVAVGGGSYCVSTLLQDDPPRPSPRSQLAEPPSATTKTTTSDDKPPTSRLLNLAQSRPRSTVTRSTTRRRRSAGSATQHERQAAVSPPAVTRSSAPVEEFGPGPASPAPPAPAAAPTSGAPEFP
jgi:hypothetical protein